MNSKYLLISWSPRKGNTDYILQTIFDSLTGNKDILFLKDKTIKHCTGCLYCHDRVDCSIKDDDMKQIRNQILEADTLIIWSPNYFDSIPWLLRNLIDRTHPFYKPELIKWKKLYLIYNWWGKTEWTKKHLDAAFHWFIKYHKLELKM